MKPSESHWYKSDVNKSRISLQVLGNRVKEYIHPNSYKYSTLHPCWKRYLSTQQLNEKNNAFKKKNYVIAKHHGSNCFLSQMLPEKSRVLGLKRTFSKFSASKNMRSIIKTLIQVIHRFFLIRLLWKKLGLHITHYSKRIIKVLHGHISASGQTFYVVLHSMCHSKELQLGNDVELK